MSDHDVDGTTTVLMVLHLFRHMNSAFHRSLSVATAVTMLSMSLTTLGMLLCQRKSSSQQPPAPLESAPISPELVPYTGTYGRLGKLDSSLTAHYGLEEVIPAAEKR